uniref:Expressed protein n=2 Tax=Schizophyllum commune (strain H4-8 / FGSC 9210) TaxID=578458 RepID=D8PYP0_SCHCM
MSLSSLRRATLSREDDIPTLMDRAPEIWEKLQDLSLVKSAFETLDILDLLRECPHIETLHVDAFNWPMHRGSDDLPMVEARNLQTLLVVNRATDTHTFFRHLRVSQLRHLAIADFAPHCSSPDTQREMWSAVGNMLTRSGARLRRFMYTGDQEQLVELVQLDALRDLEELSAYEMTATKILLEALIVESGRGCLLHLNDLSLGPTYDKDAVLDKMVLSRKGTLQILELWSVIYPYDFTVLRGACADWLTLYFRNMPCWY